MLLRIIQFMVDTHVEHNVFTLAGGADDHFLRSAGQVSARLVRGGKPARGFNDEIDARVLPSNRSRLALREDLDRPVIDTELTIPRLDTTRKRPVVGVVLEPMSIRLQSGNVVDRDDLK